MKLGIFLTDFSKNIQMSNLMKIRSMGAELFHAYGRTDLQTDMIMLIVAFRNFVNVPKKTKTYGIGIPYHK